ALLPSYTWPATRSRVMVRLSAAACRYRRAAAAAAGRRELGRRLERPGQALERAVDSGQLGRRAALDDAAAFDDEHGVGAADGGEAVGDDDGAAAVQEPVERALDHDLGRPVDVRGRLVQDQDARVGEQRAGDRDQLALARGEAGAALAHLVLEAAVQPPQQPVEADRGGRVAHVRVARAGPGEADVVGDRAREQEWVL